MSRQVRFVGGDGVRLAGVLTAPPGKGSRPGVVLVPGSGPTDRDGNQPGLRTRLLKDLADRLTRSGFVVLRYDKRGVGLSPPPQGELRLTGIVADLTGALRFLRAQPEVDRARTALVGHSQGATLSLLLAARAGTKGPAALVLLAGPFDPLDRIIRRQTQFLLRLRGVGWMGRRVVGMQTSARHKRIRAFRAGGSRSSGPGYYAFLRDLFAVRTSPLIKRIKVPILVLQGSKDYQVPPAQAGKFKALCERLKRRSCRVEIIDGLDHLMKRTPGRPGPALYLDHSRPTAPEVLSRTVSWLTKRLAKK